MWGTHRQTGLTSRCMKSSQQVRKNTCFSGSSRCLHWLSKTSVTVLTSHACAWGTIVAISANSVQLWRSWHSNSISASLTSSPICHQCEDTLLVSCSHLLVCSWYDQNQDSHVLKNSIPLLPEADWPAATAVSAIFRKCPESAQMRPLHSAFKPSVPTVAVLSQSHLGKGMGGIACTWKLVCCVLPTNLALSNIILRGTQAFLQADATKIQVQINSQFPVFEGWFCFIISFILEWC